MKIDQIHDASNVAEVLTIIQQYLKKHHISQYNLEARLILMSVLSVSLEKLLLCGDDKINIQQKIIINDLLSQRLQHKPLAYILGYKEFYGRNFSVNEHVLIPRPETEMIIDIVMHLSQKRQNLRILDLGTGSGAIAITLALEFETAEVVAVDISQDALKVASNNALLLGASNNVKFIKSDWFDNLKRNIKFDFIISNPPYISHDDPELDKRVREYEPNVALFAGSEGLENYEKILKYSVDYLQKDAKIIFEIGHTQALKVIDIANQHGYKHESTFKDCAGLNRNLIFSYK